MMWKKVEIGDKNFILRKSVKDKSHEIILSDFSKVWIENLSENELLKRCKEHNPLYEAEPDVLIKRINELIEPRQENVNKELIEVGNQLTLSFSSYMNGILFRFQFKLILATSEKFCQHLTFPLMQMIEELQARQTVLCNLLMKKDIEINEYKMEGATLTRKNIITEPFNEQKFLESCSSTDAEKQALSNFSCPYSYFEESCSKLYEECLKRKRVAEEALLMKKSVREIIKEEAEKKETTKRKKTNELLFADKEEEIDNDETYFSGPRADVKPIVKTEVKKPVVNKKKKLLNIL